MDLRYHYARLGAGGWHTEEIAHAGTRLYPGEDDYSGLGALDPNNPDVLYISTDADPVSGKPLISAADNMRHYELFRGERSANGKWTFTAFTRNSTFDNLRPLIPKWSDRRTALVWMRGAYKANQGEWYRRWSLRSFPRDERRYAGLSRAAMCSLRSSRYSLSLR